MAAFTERATLLLVMLSSGLCGQQVTISRIESMPDRPSPYVMRNWKSVARGYDSLAFSSTASGLYLPLMAVRTNTVNYPAHSSFTLPSYVGSASPATGEGVNCLPAVISASLVGIDKSNQNGNNWVLMCEEWFNKRPPENLYLNLSVTTSGSDWWYETMPNVFFYQLSSLYPVMGDFQNQFTTVANRWLAALKAMGGSAAPWRLPNADHRAWSFSTMTANDAGVHEPEASGAIGWLLYCAWTRTGDVRYRIGAEWAMEYLNGLQTNPSYELQLAYGVLLGARMNAELGTTYDVTKMLTWCFDVGPLRNWGTMSGTDNWFGYDCAGLVGEVNGVDNYAFAMNTFEQIGALVPIVRYDSRFAHAIAKWVLNAANAARLFYPNYLPDANQDSRSWSSTYDSNSCIAHEALRQYQSYSGPSNNMPGPFATGDAIKGGWAATNLSLYSSSHAGILGGIIDTTNVPMILRLDLLKTDYFHGPAFPTYLYFNPDSVQHFVDLDLGTGRYDVYDDISHTFVSLNSMGVVSLLIAPKGILVGVISPAGGTVTRDLEKVLINGVVVDYHSGSPQTNYPPRIKSLVPDSSLVLVRSSVHVYCTATDRDNDTLSYAWRSTGGTVIGTGSVVSWLAPDTMGTFVVACTVDDGHGTLATETDTFSVVRTVNLPPVILKLNAVPRKLDLGASTVLRCSASDPDNDALTYHWAISGSSWTANGAVVTWQAPSAAGNYYVRCVVDDGRGGITLDSIGIEVRDFRVQQSGTLVMFLPFDGNLLDASGFHHDGHASGGAFVVDRFGHPSGAYAFDGLTSSIAVANDTGLNFQYGITVNFWMSIHAFYLREQYPISHGNWPNRWKISITNNRLRWTVRTATGIKDLDSESQLVLDSLYSVTASYNGSDVEIYLNGALDAFTAWNGLLMQTSYDLTIGQELPGNNNYNFNGILDDVRLYNYALSVQQIASLFNPGTPVGKHGPEGLAQRFALQQNYPNPFNPSTHIRIVVPLQDVERPVKLEIFDMLGRTVDNLVVDPGADGSAEVLWDARKFPSGVYYYRVTTSDGVQTRKMMLTK